MRGALPKDAQVVGLEVRWTREMQCNDRDILAALNGTDSSVVDFAAIKATAPLKSDLELYYSALRTLSTRFAADCGEYKDTDYVWQLPSGQLSDESSCFVRADVPWPTDPRAPTR